MLPNFRVVREVTVGEALASVRSGAVLVTANRRLARSLRERYNTERASAGEPVWVTPLILPWAAWLETLWEQRLYQAKTTSVPVRLSAGQEQFVWERIVQGSPEAEKLLSLSGIAQAASESWALMHAWRVDRREVERSAGEDALAFLGWCSEFERVCSLEGWIDAARMPDQLAASIQPSELPRHLLLAGFDELTPQQKAFLDMCEGADVRIERIEAGQAAVDQTMRVACADRKQEIRAAARWARSRLEMDVAKGGIAIVVPGLEGRRREVECVLREVFEPNAILPGASRRRRVFNISAGASLLEYPLVRAAFLALNLDFYCNPVGELGAFLRSRYIRAAQSERSSRAVLDAQLRKLGLPQIPIGLVQDKCREPICSCPELGRALVAWRRRRISMPERQRPGLWARNFSELLAALGWPGNAALASEEYQVSEAWGRLLSEFAQLDVMSAQFTYSEAVSRLQRIASETMFQPESEDTPVQVLGTLEAAGAHFNCLWIAGMDDEKWPPPASPDPFLPVAVQRVHNLPHSSAQRELEFAKLRTQRLLASARTVIVSHALRDGDRQLGPSPLVRGIAEVSMDALGVPDYTAFAERIYSSASIETFVDRNGPELGSGWQSGGTNVFRYQALCPFRAYAELRLGAVPLETPEEGLGRRERGILVHAALEDLWRTLGSHARLNAADENELAQIVRCSIEHAIVSLVRKRGGELPPKLGELERQRLEKLLTAWLEVEKRRPDFTVIEPEREREVEINGLRARIRIDRIDRLENGREVIIDYKTGEVQSSFWEGERPSDPQLPLYAVSHLNPLAAIAFAQVKTGKLEFKGLAGDDAVLPGVKEADLAAEIAKWRSVLENLAAAFSKGQAEVDPKEPDTCRNCPLGALCRIEEVEFTASALIGEAS